MTESAAEPREILVPLDGSNLAEHALPYAAALAGPSDTLRLVTVVASPAPLRGPLGGSVVPDELLLRMQVDGALADLEAEADRWQVVIPKIDIGVVGGDPAGEILDLAAERGSSLIVIASHGRGSLGRWTYGSVADRIVREAGCPVLVVRPRETAPEVAPAQIERVVVPLDGSKMAEAALSKATDLAKRRDIPVHLVTVLDISAIQTAIATGVHASVQLLGSIDALKETIQRYLAEEVSALEAGGLTVTSEFREGSPADELLAAVTASDLVVMTSHGRSGIRRWLLGSVADKLVRHAAAPVIVVRAPAESDESTGAGAF